MVVNPVTGAVYVSNTDANNMDRFEGFGTPNLRGELQAAVDGGVSRKMVNVTLGASYSLFSMP